MTFAAYVKDARAKAGLTLNDVAQRSGGLKIATISAWENGTRGSIRPPSPDALRMLARGLRRPEREVFEAAGRDYQAANEAEAGNARVRRMAHLTKDLSDEDFALVEAQVRALRRQRGY